MWVIVCFSFFLVELDTFLSIMASDSSDRAQTRSRTQCANEQTAASTEGSVEGDSDFSLPTARLDSPRDPVLVTPSLDSLSDSNPQDGLSDSTTLKEILRVQLQLLEHITAERRTPQPCPLWGYHLHPLPRWSHLHRGGGTHAPSHGSLPNISGSLTPSVGGGSTTAPPTSSDI